MMKLWILSNFSPLVLLHHLVAKSFVIALQICIKGTDVAAAGVVNKFPPLLNLKSESIIVGFFLVFI